jgi:Gpi18-like mannosyltransferase
MGRARRVFSTVADWGTAHQIASLLILLGVSLGVRLAFFQVPGYYLDLNTFSAWYNYAAEHGLSQFYISPNWSDYPPFNAYIFWIFGKLGLALGTGPAPFLLKLPSNLFDLGTAALIFLFLRRRTSPGVALGVATLYAFNPATIFNVAVWGQMDSVYTFFIVGTLWALLDRRYEACGCLFALGVLAKPQTAILLPVVAFVMLKQGGWRRTLFSALAFWAVVGLVVLSFRPADPFYFLGERYAGYFVYPYTSLNAYNFWALGGFWASDAATLGGLSLQYWGLIYYAAFLLLVLPRYYRRPDWRSTVFVSFLLFFGFFMLMTRMHERYLFPVLAMLAMAWPFRPARWLYGGLTATYLFNVAYVMAVLNANSAIPAGHWTILTLVPANAILFGYAVVSFYAILGRAGANDRSTG